MYPGTERVMFHKEKITVTAKLFLLLPLSYKTVFLSPLKALGLFYTSERVSRLTCSSICRAGYHRHFGALDPLTISSSNHGAMLLWLILDVKVKLTKLICREMCVPETLSIREG